MIQTEMNLSGENLNIHENILNKTDDSLNLKNE